MESPTASEKPINPHQFLNAINKQFSNGELGRNPKLSQRIQQEGNQPSIWDEAFTRLEKDSQRKNKKAMQRDLRNARLLGMDEEPEIKHWLDIWELEYGIQKPPKPADEGRRDFLSAAGAAIFMGVAAPTILGLQAATRAIQSSREPEQTPEKETTIFDEFIKPMKEQVRRRRQERAKSDPEYYHRVDRFLNEDEKGNPTRINALLFSVGTSLRPGNPPVVHAANQILSVNLISKTVDFVAITSETRAVNIERYLKAKGKTPTVSSINGAFDIGQLEGGDEEGFNLMRQTFEQATGLSMDFQAILSDGTIKDFIDHVLNGLDIDIPYHLPTYKIDVDGTEYPAKEFTQGPQQHLDGARVVQFMKGEDPDGKWVQDRLPHHRKNIIMNAIVQSFKKNIGKLTLIPDFIEGQMKAKRTKLDFDLNGLFNFNALSSVLNDPTMIGRLGFNELRVGQTITMMNQDMGGEGVRYVAEDREENPITERDIAAGVYPNHYEGIPGAEWWSGVTVPYNGNPYAEDLVTHYWGETRKVARRRLLPKAA